MHSVNILHYSFHFEKTSIQIGIILDLCPGLWKAAMLTTIPPMPPWIFSYISHSQACAIYFLQKNEHFLISGAKYTEHDILRWELRIQRQIRDDSCFQEDRSILMRLGGDNWGFTEQTAWAGCGGLMRSFNKYLLSSNSVPGAVLDARDVMQIRPSPCS